MFLDDQSSKSPRSHQPVHLFSSTLRRNVIQQAASMLVRHVTKSYHFMQNSNGNALDERRYRRRTKKCNSWLSKLPTKSDTSLNRLPIFFQSPSRDFPPAYPPINPSTFSIHQSASRFPRHHLTLSSNASSNIDPPLDTISQPLMLIHKKRLRRDDFLFTMQNCIQPPYSPNHFYALDQFNLLKLQRQNLFHPKRKYFEVDDDEEPEYIPSEVDFHRASPSKKQLTSPLQTADHISINKYHDEKESPMGVDEKAESQIILLRLEKILNLCGELRSLATDVENHLHVKQSSLSEENGKSPVEKSESEQTIIDIYKELEVQQVMNETNAPPPYQRINETLSIHSESEKSHSLMQTESFKTKSTSQTTLPKPEDLCSCFLKSIFENDKCQLNPKEQEYLNQLTKAYLLGREQILKEQHEENNKFQAFIDEKLPDEQHESDLLSSLKFDTNNNNKSTISLKPSSILLYNNSEKPDDHPPLGSSHSNSSFNQEQQSTIHSGMITAKHQVFITEPIAMKTTDILPGIGTKYAQQLAECGFSTVRCLLGFYLMIKDDRNFVKWLHSKVQISTHSAWLCTNALRAWCQTHL